MSDDFRVGRQIEVTGSIFAQYVYFDYLVSSVIWHLLNLKKDLGMMITGNLDIQPKIDMAIEIAIYKGELADIQKKLTTFKNSTVDCESIFSKRNQIVQGLSFDFGDGIERDSNNPPKKSTELSIEYYDKVHDEICEVNNDMVLLMKSCNISVH